MKKLNNILSIFFMLLLTLSFVFIISCKKQEGLLPYITELRSNIYEGKSKNYSLIAGYGFTTDNNIKTYALTIKLIGKESENVTYYAKFSYNQLDFNEKFSFGPIKNCLVATLYLENFNENQFIITVFNGIENEQVEMVSTVPNNTISYSKALEYFESEHKTTIQNLTNENGNFEADIILRVIVKNNKPYWYLGLMRKNGNLKALLIDGISGKTLAIREVL